jgi:hypothetical protein
VSEHPAVTWLREALGRAELAAQGYGTDAQLDLLMVHGPAAVMRWVAAAREQLDEHADDGSGDCTVCARESEERNGLGYAFHEPLPWPCRTVLLLAKAWGWTEG